MALEDSGSFSSPWLRGLLLEAAEKGDLGRKQIEDARELLKVAAGNIGGPIAQRLQSLQVELSGILARLEGSR